MKKFLAILLTMVLALTFVLPAFAETPTLVVCWWGNQTRNERTQKWLDLFAQSHDVKFDTQYMVWADYWSKLATQSSGNELPDFIQMDYAYITPYSEAGLLLDLTPYIESGALDIKDMSDALKTVGNINGGVYGIANSVNAPCMLYNKTLLDSIGITVKDNMTIDDFLAICREVFEKTGYKTCIDASATWVELLLRESNTVMYPNGSLGGTVEEYENFFKILEIGNQEGWLIDNALMAERIGQEQRPLVYGNTPAERSWCATSAWSNQVEAYLRVADFEMGITTHPCTNPDAANYLKPSMLWSISANCKNPDLAVELMNWYFHDIDCNLIDLAERGLPVIPATAEAIYDSLSDANKAASAFVYDVVAPHCSPINPPNGLHYEEANTLFTEMFNSVAYGYMSAREAAEMFVEQGGAIMAQ